MYMCACDSCDRTCIPGHTLCGIEWYHIWYTFTPCLCTHMWSTCTYVYTKQTTLESVYTHCIYMYTQARASLFTAYVCSVYVCICTQICVCTHSHVHTCAGKGDRYARVYTFTHTWDEGTTRLIEKRGHICAHTSRNGTCKLACFLAEELLLIPVLYCCDRCLQLCVVTCSYN